MATRLNQAQDLADYATYVARQTGFLRGEIIRPDQVEILKDHEADADAIIGTKVAYLALVGHIAEHHGQLAGKSPDEARRALLEQDGGAAIMTALQPLFGPVRAESEAPPMEERGKQEALIQAIVALTAPDIIKEYNEAQRVVESLGYNK